MKQSTRELSLSAALVPLITMFVGFAAGSALMDFGPALLVLVMLIAAAVAGAQAVRVGSTWDDIQRSTGEKLASVLPAILILLTIGMLIGTWVLSGTIPTLIYFGIKLVNPGYMVVTAFLGTAVMSLCTGTSWGSAGTIGVALMGMATALGAPLAATAGAVVSGAYFGDKMSPLSDSTNICAIGAKADLYAHIKNMVYTALPSFIIATVVYFLVGMFDTGVSEELPPRALDLLGEIRSLYNLHWLTLLPPAVVIAGIVFKFAPVLVMAASSLVAMAIGVGVQGFRLQDAMSAAVNGFDPQMVHALGIDPASLSVTLVGLLSRGGLYSMVNTLLVIICAFLLAAGLDVSGALDLIIRRMLNAVRSVFGLIAATMAAGTTMISLTSHGGVTALIVGGLFQKAYQKQGLAPQNLSRSLEDSVTIVEPLMPWTVSAIYMAATVGIPTIDYAPWAVFCYSGPLFSMVYAALFRRTNFGLVRLYVPQTGSITT